MRVRIRRFAMFRVFPTCACKVHGQSPWAPGYTIGGLMIGGQRLFGVYAILCRTSATESRAIWWGEDAEDFLGIGAVDMFERDSDRLACAHLLTEWALSVKQASYAKTHAG